MVIRIGFIFPKVVVNCMEPNWKCQVFQRIQLVEFPIMTDWKFANRSIYKTNKFNVISKFYSEFFRNGLSNDHNNKIENRLIYFTHVPINILFIIDIQGEINSWKMMRIGEQMTNSGNNISFQWIHCLHKCFHQLYIVIRCHNHAQSADCSEARSFRFTGFLDSIVFFPARWNPEGKSEMINMNMLFTPWILFESQNK